MEAPKSPLFFDRLKIELKKALQNIMLEEKKAWLIKSRVEDGSQASRLADYELGFTSQAKRYLNNFN